MRSTFYTIIEKKLLFHSWEAPGHPDQGTSFSPDQPLHERSPTQATWEQAPGNIHWSHNYFLMDFYLQGKSNFEIFLRV